MNAAAEWKAALRGWFEMIAMRPAGRERFVPTTAGLLNAVGFYLAVVLVSLGVDAILGQAPSATTVLSGFLANCLPLVAVALVVFATIATLRLDVAFLQLAVPAVYALGLVLLIGLPFMVLSASAFSNVLLATLGYMLYRAARDIGKMSIGVSIAFAALSIVALVALPLGLYMLTMPATPAA